MPEIYDTTTQLQKFLEHNTLGGYFQTELNISSDNLNNRIDSYLNGKGYLNSSSTISYKQIEAALKDNIKTVGYTGLYKDLQNKPNFPNGYNEWLLPNSIENPPTFHKVAFTGKYTDLDLTGAPNANSPSLSTITWDQITQKPALATYGLNVPPYTDGNQNNLFSLAKVAITGSYDDLTTKITKDNLKELGLKEVAFTGSYLNLSDRPSGISSSEGNILIDSQIDIHNIMYHFDKDEQDTDASKFCRFAQAVYYNINETQIDSVNRITITDILNNLILGYQNSLQITDQNFQYNKKIVKILTNIGAFELIDVSEFNGIIIFNFSPLDTYKIFNAAQISRNSNILDNLEQLEPNFIVHTLYYQTNENKLIIKQSKILSKTDVKNDIVKIYDITTSTIENFSKLIEGPLDTTQRYLSTNPDSITLNNWLQDVIEARQQHMLIQIRNYFNDIILTDLKKKNGIYLFCFTITSDINNSNCTQIRTFDDEEENPLNALDRVSFDNYFIYFIYDEQNNKLWIKRKKIKEVKD